MSFEASSAYANREIIKISFGINFQFHFLVKGKKNEKRIPKHRFFVFKAFFSRVGECESRSVIKKPFIHGEART